MVKRGAVWAALLGIAFASGAVFDPRPSRPIVHRAGFRVLEGDFHAHTTYSDGSLSPFGLVRQAERQGLDVVGVTEHNTVWPAKIARTYSRLAGGPLVVVGEEITTARFHVIALGLTNTVTAAQPIAGVLADIHAQGGFAIAAHPVRAFWPSLLPVRASFDGAEVFHPIAFSSRPGWQWTDMVTFYEEASPPLTAIGSSDYHFGSVLGMCRTLVFVEEPGDEASVLRALKERRTVVIDHRGHMFGDPALVAALEREPVVVRSGDLLYRGQNEADRILRAIGFVGLVGLVLFGAQSAAGHVPKKSPPGKQESSAVT
jgi:hypothetical protein